MNHYELLIRELVLKAIEFECVGVIPDEALIRRWIHQFSQMFYLDANENMIFDWIKEILE